MKATVGVTMQRMRAAKTTDSGATPVIGIQTITSSILEQDTARAQIIRLSGMFGQACSVKVTWTSSGGDVDLLPPLSTVYIIPAFEPTLEVAIGTATRAGNQGTRTLQATLSEPVDCLIDPTHQTAGQFLFDRDDPLPPPVINATQLSPSETEGALIRFAAARGGGTDSIECSFRYTFSSTGGAADFSGAVTGIATIPAGVTSVDLIAQTVNRSGAQGTRTITVALSEPVDCLIGTASATMSLVDYVPPTVLIGAYRDQASAKEGETFGVTVKRTGSSAAAISANYAWTSSGTLANDLAGPTYTGVVTIPVGETEVRKTIASLPQSGNQGDRTITFTLSSPTGGTLETGHIAQNMTLQDYTAPASTSPKYLPPATLNDRSKWHCVGFTPSGAAPKAVYGAGRAGLLAAVTATNWVPGDVIRLDDGDYNGAKITITRSGTASADGRNHLMITSRNHRRATINFQLDIQGEYVWLSGLSLPFSDSSVWDMSSGADNWTKMSQSVIVRKKGAWITNCNIPAPTSVYYYCNNGDLSNLRLNYNDMFSTLPANVPNCTLIMFYMVFKNHNAPADTEIAYNDITMSIKGTGSSGDDKARTVINMQRDKPQNKDLAVRKDFRVHHNRFVGYFRYFIYTKRNVYVGFNVFENKSDMGTNIYVAQRHGILTPMLSSDPTYGQYGIGGQYEGNLFKCNKKWSMEINGHGNTINNNKKTGTADMVVCLKAGSLPPLDEPNNLGEYDATDYARVIENEGFDSVIVGEITDNAKDHMALDRGGWPNNVQIYKGDSNWNPAITKGVDVNGARPPDGAWAVNPGGLSYPSGYVKVTPVVEADLAPMLGCDPIA